MDENSLGVAKALQHVRGDLTWPGAPGGPVSQGARDVDWLPIVGAQGLIVLTRDKNIRKRPHERAQLVAHGVRACFLTSGGQLALFDQLRVWLRWWDDIERLADTEPGPWLASVTASQGVRLFEQGRAES
ncbi:hypothetical protein [Actinomycetospora soli]|uniref:PIN-like domain-containing protein n=1 Tax=Actinomycetospora soli TaxID=2893887 RepID=UPI001E5638B2|nr:hypothetical protein [Actinomycetospora soli]MCD2187825.1 hypothetical protein [Actinomycetospora soli]